MRLRIADRAWEIDEPWVMGIVNATPDSFSDEQGVKPLEHLVARGRALVADGATLIDVGGESGRTDRPVVSVEEEIRRVVPLVERLASEGIWVSVDTWRAPVARAALDAGAVMVNDVSGLSDPELADVCAVSGAALVITHTRLPPKVKGYPDYEDVVEDVLALLTERAAEARRRGVGEDQLVFDPGFDIAKSPAESIELLRRLPELRALGRPLLAAVSRKDFLGAITERPPAARDAGTLAAVDAAVHGGAKIVRVHDVAAVRDYLMVRTVLDGGGLDPGVRLADELRREPA